MFFVFLLLGIVSVIYGFSVISVIGTGNWFNFAFIYIGIGFFVLAFIWRVLKKKNGLKILVSILLIIAFGILGVFEIKIISFGKQTPAQNADYVIVLGARVKGTSPMKEFGERINVAYDYAIDNPKAELVLTGGQGKDELIAESLAAKNTLLSKGIKESRMLYEDKSTSTRENLIYALEVIEADGGSIDSDIVIVSSRFHLYRTSILAKELGFSSTTYLGGNGLFVLLPHYYLREFAAYISEFVL